MTPSRVNKMSREADSPDKCRKARPRRIGIRRHSAAGQGGPSSPCPRWDGKKPDAGQASEPLGGGAGKKLSRTPRPLPPSYSWSASSSPSSLGGEPGAPAIASTSRPATAVAEPPLSFGSLSLSGWSREMEDAVSVRPGFFRPKGGPPLHFFAVFDGHGGSHVAALCKERMHVLLAEELGRAEAAAPRARGQEEREARMRAAVGWGFARMDKLALTACACGKVGVPLCGCERSGIESEIVGTTAVVALVGADRIVVANCGDSRAVLSRGGRAVPLSEDHKPDREDELARIEAAGGRVVDCNGARVHGMLAVSRALGDKYLKPFVISEPEIIVVERTAEDECLIVASDGLWDVIPNDLACDVARSCWEESDPTRGTEEVPHGVGGDTMAGGRLEDEHASDACCSLAAALLARLALGRKSCDNISVIVIDLRRDRG